MTQTHPVLSSQSDEGDTADLTQSDGQQHRGVERAGGSGDPKSWVQILPPLMSGDLRKVTETLRASASFLTN